MPSHNAGFCYDDEEESQFLPNEEEVYQDLVKIQKTINQVKFYFYFLSFFNVLSSLLYAISFKLKNLVLIPTNFNQFLAHIIQHYQFGTKRLRHKRVN
jgi:hypothetical protein